MTTNVHEWVTEIGRFRVSTRGNDELNDLSPWTAVRDSDSFKVVYTERHPKDLTFTQLAQIHTEVVRNVRLAAILKGME